MGHYVYVIKLKYNEKRKVRHYAHYLHSYYDRCIHIGHIVIQVPKKSHLPHSIQILKKDLYKFFCVVPLMCHVRGCIDSFFYMYNRLKTLTWLTKK